MGLEKKSRRPPTLDVWIIILGETVTRENFNLCSQAVDKSCVPKHSYLKGETAWRYIVGCLLPQFAMRQRHVPRREWSFSKTKVVEGSGKAYLSLKCDPEEPMTQKPAMGFNWAEAGSAMAFANSVGQKDVVINLGVSIRTATPIVSASSYMQSHLHQLTQFEEQSISMSKFGEDGVIRRLNILLCVKDAYLRAMGQPIGFDWSRIQCDVASESVSVDGSPLSGWEFHIFTANVDPHKKSTIPPEHLHYFVAVAVFRGHDGGCRFFWPRTENEMSFVQFYDVSQIIRDVPRLGDYDHVREHSGAMPPIEQIPLSAKSSMQSFETIKPSSGTGGREHHHSSSTQPSPLSRHSTSSHSSPNHPLAHSTTQPSPLSRHSSSPPSSSHPNSKGYFPPERQVPHRDYSIKLQ